MSGAPIQSDAAYHYRLEQGPVRTLDLADGALVFAGETLLSLAREDLRDPGACVEARRLLRAAFDRCLEGRELKSRRVMLALRRVRTEA